MARGGVGLVAVHALQLDGLVVYIEVASCHVELVLLGLGVAYLHGAYAEVGARAVDCAALLILQRGYQHVSPGLLGTPHAGVLEGDDAVVGSVSYRCCDGLGVVGVELHGIYLMVDGEGGHLLAHRAHLHIHLHGGLVGIGTQCPYGHVAHLQLGHGSEVGAADDAGQAEHVLRLQERTVAAAIYLHCHCVLTLLHVGGDVERGCVAAVLAETHVLTVDPQVEEAIYAVEVDVYVASLPLLGQGERAAVGTHFVAVLVGGVALVLGLAHHSLLPVAHLHLVVEDDGLVDVDGHTPFHGAVLAQSLHVPAAGHLYVVPCCHIVRGFEEVAWTLLGSGHPVELPRTVEGLVVGASLGQNLLGLVGGGEGEHVGARLLLVERQALGGLPFGAVGRGDLLVEESVKCLCPSHQGGRKDESQ